MGQPLNLTTGVESILGASFWFRVGNGEWCQSGWRRVTGVQGFRVFIFSGPFEEHINPHLRFPTAAQRRPSGLASCLAFSWHCLLLTVSHIEPHYSPKEESKSSAELGQGTPALGPSGRARASGVSTEQGITWHPHSSCPI